MSTNPFLNNKETKFPKNNNKINNNNNNNRFSDLQSDDQSDFKEVKYKQKKHFEYEKKSNSFTNSSRQDNLKPERSRDRDFNRDYNRRNNYESKNKIIENKIEAPDSNNVDLFPVLTPNLNNNNIQCEETKTNFKTILTNVIEDNTIIKNDVPPGCVRISFVKKGKTKTLFENGPLTPYLIKQQHKEELQLKLDDDPRYIMNKAFNAMKKNWDLYEKEYDSIHGEGAYDERFRLSPVYGSEYDTESDEENDDNEEEDKKIVNG
jgi:hypothetical protein